MYPASKFQGVQNEIGIELKVQYLLAWQDLEMHQHDLSGGAATGISYYLCDSVTHIQVFSTPAILFVCFWHQ